MTAALTGLIGHPVAHSLSPLIHDYWRAQHGIKGRYELFDIAPGTLQAELQKMKKTPLRGVNVTVPHKQSVIQALDSVDETATAIGAVNTVIADNGKWHGTNTDAYGFMAHLKAEVTGWQATLTHCTVIGAGGAARAIVHALKETGAGCITILNRTEEKAQELAHSFGCDAAPMEQAQDILATTTLLVNTSSAGMKNNAPLTLPLARLPQEAVVYDIVYVPLLTPLLAEARALNLATVDGLGMLLYQAQGAFEHWHGVHPAVTPELRAMILEKLV